MIKAVIFDMDGVIVDTDSLQSKSWEWIIKQHNKEPIKNRNGVVHTIGIKATDNWEQLKQKHGILKEKASAFEKRGKYYLQLLQKNVRSKPGIISLLKLLHAKNIKTAIASSAGMVHIETVVENLKIKQYFCVLFSGQSVSRGKPYPDTFLETAKLLQVKPEDCLVIEDAESGVLAAKSAGMKVIAIPTKFTRNQDFSQANLVLNNLTEVSEDILNQ